MDEGRLPNIPRVAEYALSVMELEFWKLSGAGNDFIAINNMDGHLSEEGRRELIIEMCRRGVSVGADGMLVLEPSNSADFRMRYYNADGSEGETCGNGSRCIARFAHLQKVAGTVMRFETMAGAYEAEILGEDVAVSVTEATGLRLDIHVADDILDDEVHFINTGVPHVVVLVDELAGYEIFDVGRHLRYHSEFEPAGTNVNFAIIRDRHNIAIRTYERGVENETLACGTGSIAASIVAAHKKLVEPPVSVRTAGGELLTIDFELTDNGARKVALRGGARIVYRGYYLGR
jgi:diaminopimelate epimerase